VYWSCCKVWRWRNASLHFRHVIETLTTSFTLATCDSMLPITSTGNPSIPLFWSPTSSAPLDSFPVWLPILVPFCLFHRWSVMMNQSLPISTTDCRQERIQMLVVATRIWTKISYVVVPWQESMWSVRMKAEFLSLFECLSVVLFLFCK
jgi:hypothetical protein